MFTAIFVAGVGLSNNPVAVSVNWTLAGCGASLMTVALQNLTVRAIPTNKGGALSVVSAFRFAGVAIAPIVWLPIYYGAAPIALSPPAARY